MVQSAFPGGGLPVHGRVSAWSGGCLPGPGGYLPGPGGVSAWSGGSACSQGGVVCLVQEGLSAWSWGVSAWSGGCLPGLGGVCLVPGGCLPGLGGSAWSGGVVSAPRGGLLSQHGTPSPPVNRMNDRQV